MGPRNDPDGIQIAFDDHHLGANAGLLLAVTLAHHLGLGIWRTATLTWELRRVGPMLATSFIRWWRRRWPVVRLWRISTTPTHRGLAEPSWRWAIP